MPNQQPATCEVQATASLRCLPPAHARSVLLLLPALPPRAARMKHTQQVPATAAAGENVFPRC
jgi:hypothetical protein